MTPADRVAALESLLQRVQHNARQRAHAGPLHGLASGAPITVPPPSDDVLELTDDEVREDEPTIPPPAPPRPPPVRQMMPLTSLDEDEPTHVRPAHADDEAPEISVGESEVALDVDFDDVHFLDEDTAVGDAAGEEVIALERQRADEERQADEARRRKAAEEESRRKAAEEESRRKAAEEESRRKAAEEESRRRAAEQAAAQREAAEREAAQRAAAEAEAARKAEAEAARAAELEAQRPAPISTRQPKPKDEVREMDFGDLGDVAGDDEEPPESGEVASQRKPTIDPAVAALADWHEEETHDAEEPGPALSKERQRPATEPPATVKGGAAEVRLRVPGLDADVEPIVITRTGAAPTDLVAFVEASRTESVESFGDLLDASLSLGA